MTGKAISLTGYEIEVTLRAIQSRIATLIQLSIKDTMVEIDALDDVIEKLQERQ